MSETFKYCLVKPFFDYPLITGPKLRLQQKLRKILGYRAKISLAYYDLSSKKCEGALSCTNKRKRILTDKQRRRNNGGEKKKKSLNRKFIARTFFEK